MYGLDGSYAQYVPFIRGCDFATGSALLQGFNGWLSARLGYESSLDWAELCLRVAFGVAEGANTVRPGTAAEETAAADALFALLDEFLADSPVAAGL